MYYHRTNVRDSSTLLGTWRFKAQRFLCNRPITSGGRVSARSLELILASKSFQGKIQVYSLGVELDGAYGAAIDGPKGYPCARNYAQHEENLTAAGLDAYECSARHFAYMRDRSVKCRPSGADALLQFAGTSTRIATWMSRRRVIRQEFAGVVSLASADVFPGPSSTKLSVSHCAEIGLEFGRDV